MTKACLYVFSRSQHSIFSQTTKVALGFWKFLSTAPYTFFMGLLIINCNVVAVSELF